MTYSQEPVAQAIAKYAIPLQIDNSKTENQKLLHDVHHIWTPDLRVLNGDGFEMYSWGGYWPPPEFIAKALCGFGMAFLRGKRYDQAEECYLDALMRFSTTHAAAEAQYYLGVTRYRRDPDSDELLIQWEKLRSRYPNSEFRMRQSFKDFPDAGKTGH